MRRRVSTCIYSRFSFYNHRKLALYRVHCLVAVVTLLFEVHCLVAVVTLLFEVHCLVAVVTLLFDGIQNGKSNTYQNRSHLLLENVRV